MYDLLKEKGREKLFIFAQNFFAAIEHDIPTPKPFKPIVYQKFNYVPGDAKNEISTVGKKVVILTDSENDQTNIGRMIEKLRGSFSGNVETVNLHSVDIKGGCPGCIQCGYDYECSYTGKDEFIEFYNSKVRTADILIFAGAIKDRYLSSRSKLFFDRSFFNTHTPSLIGKQIGLIIPGPLSQIPNLRQILV